MQTQPANTMIQLSGMDRATSHAVGGPIYPYKNSDASWAASNLLRGSCALVSGEVASEKRVKSGKI